jgi:hypothetical protein
MSELIKELAKRATKEVWGNNPHNGAPEFQGYELDQELFAELLILKCAHLVGGYTKENEFGTDVKEAYEEITKHFGVKE